MFNNFLILFNSFLVNNLDTPFISVRNYTPEYQHRYLFKDSIYRPMVFKDLYLNAVGLYSEAIESSKDRWGVYTDMYKDSINSIIQEQDAVEAIISEAKKFRILMINEHHIQPQNRMFTLLLSKRLKEIGYDFFGAEGIEYLDSIAIKYKMPNVAGGYYLNEPTYGKLIRAYMQNNYQIFSYDITTDTTFFKTRDTLENGDVEIKYRTSALGNCYELYDKYGTMKKSGLQVEYRDSAMVNNFLKLYFANPTSKFVIHCGHNHLFENDTWMASILKNRIKEDILTIDQTEFIQLPDGLNNPIYDSLVRNHPVVYKLKSQNYLTAYPNEVDMSVVHPKLNFIHGKPDWMLWDSAYSIRKLKGVRQKVKTFPTIVKVYFKNEFSILGNHATPIDVVYFENEKELEDKWFCLPKKGKLVIRYQIKANAQHGK